MGVTFVTIRLSLRIKRSREEADLTKSTSGKSFHTIGLVGRAGNPMVTDSVLAVERFLSTTESELVLEAVTGSMLSGHNYETMERAALGERCDLVVVVGGDGSILGVARDLAESQVPIVGVNRGGLGFLADVAPDQIEQKIGAVLAGQYTIDERFLLEARIVRDDEFVEGSSALNDGVVHAGTMSRMMDFSLYVDRDLVYEQRSDGLIVASPTGSTAYSLSAGGPIMHPSLDAIVVVPMFPHTLTSRPLVVRGDADIKVVIAKTAEMPKFSCDSQVDHALRGGDEVHIAKHPHSLNLLYPLGHSFFESCRSKLDWASRLGDG